MPARVRKSVYSIADDAPELEWYRRAVGHLKTLPRNQPGSWEFVAACHGIAGVPAPAPNGLWNECQHQTWFFLPWHRGYLVGFESIIADTVAALGGPANWALPYWDYSDTSNPRARELPPAFRNRFLADGSINDLWSPRNRPVPPNPALTLSPGDVSLAAMASPNFTNPPGSRTTGFGGRQTGWNHGGGASGDLEARPHNVVHTGIGGLMANPLTAALDPIFWLHHCNIDRLWEVWRGLQSPIRDPSAPAWLTGVKFKLVQKKGTPFNFQCVQALDTQTLLHGYKYDNVTPVVPSVLVATGGPGPVVPHATAATRWLTVSPMAVERFPNLIAASAEPLRLSAENTETVVRPERRQERGLFSLTRAGEPKQFFLSLENVVAQGTARDYKVFVDLPQDNRMPLQVGLLATFGVNVASDADGPHGGNGLSQVFDITDALTELGIGAGAFNDLRVTFEPVRREGLEDVPADYQYADLIDSEPSDLTVGRINLYAE